MKENLNIETVNILLDNGEVIQVEARSSFRENVSCSNCNIGDVSNQLKEISKLIIDSFRDSKPDKLSVELGIEFSVETGKLTAILVKGCSTANLKINLEWNNHDIK